MKMKDFVFDHDGNNLSSKLLKFLKPVGFNFSSCLAEEWLINLIQISNIDEENLFVKKYYGKGKDDQKNIFYTISEKIIQHLSSIRKDNFTLLFASITLDVYSRFLSHAAWTDLIKEYVPDSIEYINDPIDLLVNLFESVYFTGNNSAENFSNRSDSLAFWYGARAVFTYKGSVRKDLVRALNSKDDSLKSYFSILGSENDNEGLVNSNNLFLDYLIRRTKNNNSPLSDVGGYVINDARKSIFYYQRKVTNFLEDVNRETIDVVPLVKKAHNIVVLGESRSGKTTIVKQLKHTSEFGNDVEPNFALDKFHDSENKNEIIDYWSIDIPYPPETREKTVALQGNFQSFGADVSLYLYDHNGALFKDDAPRRISMKREEKNELEKLCEECDQLIVTVPPFLIDNNNRIDNVLTRLFHYVRLAILSNKNVVISIVYTMCDDYGCIIDGPRRVINDTKGAELFHVFKYETGQEKNLAWENFVNYSNASEVTNIQWLMVKRHLLQKTKELWRKIAHSTGENHFNINGYFVSAMHPGQEKDIKNFNKRGVLEIISDYLQFMSPPRNFKLTVSANENPENREVILTWEHNGPYMKEYRIYTSQDKRKLLQKGANVFSLKQLLTTHFRDTYISPIKVENVEYDLETNLPKMNEIGLYSYQHKHFQLNEDLYYQVVAIDKFNYLAFSDISHIRVPGRHNNLWDWFLSQSKSMRILIGVAVLLTVVLIIMIICFLIESSASK